jgi:cytochrome c
MRLASPIAVAAVAIASALPVFAAGDAGRGAQVYNRCVACHALATDRVGPRHCGLVGRRAGSVPGFLYSDAMRASRLTWDEKTLDLFLAKPMTAVPGTTMTYDGVPDPKDRADLIAYLKHATTSAECRK